MSLLLSFTLLAGQALPFLDEVVALLVASVLIAYLCYRAKLVPIAGFLLTGVIIGPGALGLVEDQELVTQLAEIGVVLLLFTIGVEFSLERLARVQRLIFLGGGLQVGLTIVAIVLVLLAFGVDWRAGIFSGCLVALSSTAVVLGLLSDRAETDSPTGRVALAVLIFQDLAIIVMVLLVPILGGQQESALDVLLALGEAVLLIAVVLVAALRAVPWLLERVARTKRQELFLLTTVAICFGTAWLTSLVGVSLALGAFLAGIMVSESRYSEQALSEIVPLSTLFSAVFFVSIGMLLDLGFLLQNLPLVIGIAAGLLLLKALITSGTVIALGFPTRIAVASGLTLAQIGEFSFVLAIAGREVGLYPAGLGTTGEQLFIAVSVLLMLATPLLIRVGPGLGVRLERVGPTRRSGREPEADAVALEDHVIMVGYGPSGQRLARVLRDTGIPFEIIELNPSTVAEAKAEGLPILYGDASRPHILNHAGIQRAKLCVVAINDRPAARRIVQVAHYLNPTLQIIVRTRFLVDIEPLHRLGADIVVPEELETAVRIFSHVLGAYMVPPEEIEQHVSSIRAGDYRVLRGSIQEAHLMVLQGLDEEGLHTRAVAVREGAPVVRKTLAELALRQQHALTVLAIRRGRRTIGNPAGTFRLEPGDRLVLIGTAEDFAASADLFRETRLDLDAEPGDRAPVEEPEEAKE